MKIIRGVFGVAFVTLAISFSLLIYFSYKDYVQPDNVYGTWIEIGAPPYNTEKLKFNEHGVYRNGRLIATKFKFDGSTIEVKTGRGRSVYEISGTHDSPQLRRLIPNSPTQRLIKSGYEDTVNMEGGGPAKNRRAALQEHFSDN
ncbi:DUF2850 domain-containing protein [Vibrio sp. AK197]